MTAFLVVVGIVLGYLTIGAVYARSQSVRLYRKARKTWIYDDMWQAPYILTMLWRIVFWPYAVVFDLAHGPVMGWFMGPVHERQEKARALAEDAKVWAEEARKETDPEKKRMAEELARVLGDRAKEMEL